MSDEGTRPDQGAAPPPAVAPSPPTEDRTTRRLLYFVLGLLLIAALALLVFLIYLLWPKGSSVTESAEGYPIVPVRSILGYGDAPEEMLDFPLGVTFDSQGDVWISDTGHSRILEFNQDGELLQTVGTEEGPGKLFSPNGLTFDDEGNLYVADWRVAKVLKFSPEGAYLQSYPDPEQDPKVFKVGGFAPYDVQVVDGQVVAATRNGLVTFDQEGFYTGRFGDKIAGGGDDQFNFVNAFMWDEFSERYYIADTMNKRVIAMNPEGDRVWTSGSPDEAGSTTGFWQLPRGMARGPDCDIYAIDTFRPTESGMGDGYFVQFSPDGTLKSLFGKFGEEDDAFNLPEKLAYYGPDDIWAVVDRGNRRVLLFRLLESRPSPDPVQAQAWEESFTSDPELAGALPSLTPGTCIPSVAVAGSGFPWWIVILVVVVVLLAAALRRILKDRGSHRRGGPPAEAAAPEPAHEPGQGT